MASKSDEEGVVSPIDSGTRVDLEGNEVIGPRDTDPSLAMGRTRRELNPTEKGRAYQIGILTELFISQRVLLVSAIAAAADRVTQERPMLDSLALARLKVTHSRTELSNTYLKLEELGGADAVREEWDSAQMIAQESISNVVIAITAARSEEASSKARSHRSSKTASYRSLKKKSVTGSTVSDVSSALSAKTQLRMKAASLSVKRESQTIESQRTREIEDMEEQESYRRADREAARTREEADREAARRSEEADRLALEGARNLREVKARAQFERRKGESLRELELLKTDTDIKTNAAMLYVLEEGDTFPPEPPSLPPLSLLDSRFHPHVSQPIVAPPQTLPIPIVTDTHSQTRDGQTDLTDVQTAVVGAADIAAPTGDPAQAVADAAATSDAQRQAAAYAAEVCTELRHPSVYSAAPGIYDPPPLSTAPTYYRPFVLPGAARLDGSGGMAGLASADAPAYVRRHYAALTTETTTTTAAYSIATTPRTSTLRPPTSVLCQPPQGALSFPHVTDPTATRGRPSSDRELGGLSFSASMGEVNPHHLPFYYVGSSRTHLSPDAQTFVPPPSVLLPPVSQSSRHMTGVSGHYPTNSEYEHDMPFRTTRAPVYDGSHFQPAHPHFPTHDVPTQDAPSTDSLAQTLADALLLNRLPLQEPVVYYGDPLLYPTWKIAFRFLIQRQRITPSEKLLYLQRYIGGVAKEAVSSYFLLQTPDAFDSAMSVLEERYGSSYVVSQAFRTKLEEWPIIGNGDHLGLRRLADYLRQCAVATKEVGGLEVFNEPQYQKRIIAKTPYQIADRWARIVATSKLDRGRYPNFEELVKYMTKEANIRNDPIFGPGAFSPANRRTTPLTPTNTPSRKTTMNTLTETVLACEFCRQSSHCLPQCDDFAKKDATTKRDYIFKNNLCFGCLRSKDHQSKQCRQKEVCDTCKRNHPTCLHERFPDFRPRYTRESIGRGADDRKTGSRTNSDQSAIPNAAASVTFSRSAVPKVSTASAMRTEEGRRDGLTSMIVPVWLSTNDDPSCEVRTYALLDTMSNATFVVESLADQVHADHHPTTLKLTTLTDRDALIAGRKYTGLRVRAASANNTEGSYLDLPPAIARPHLSLDLTQVPTPEAVASHPHLRHLASELSPLLPDCVAGLLIGFDCAQALMPIQVVEGDPYAVQTKLGWSVIGASKDTVVFDELGSSLRVDVKTGTTQEEAIAFVYKSTVTEMTKTDLVRILERDFADTDGGVMSQDDVRFLRIVTENVKVNDQGHYEMPLPFRPDKPSLPDNRYAAMKRMTGLKRQFERKPDYLRDYVQFMETILDRGDAELVPAEQIDTPGRWYIPHHGVYSPKKPGKIRVVFDCSARHLGTSLNDLLLQGPDQISSLIGVLCRFRKGPIAFSCDIEKMFHQFHVHEPHRDFLRFLWWNNGDTTEPLLDYRMKVHIFGATSSPGCANFGLKQVARDNAEVSLDASTFLQRDFYVDDGLQARETIDDAVNVLTKAREICEKGGLRLHKIISNSPDLLARFPDSEVSSTKAADLSAPSAVPAVERTLGLQWSTTYDTLGFSNEIKKGASTRRGVLSTIASLYDPLGFLAPFILLGRIILQKMCLGGLDWDDPLPATLQERWDLWLADFANLDQVQIQRNYLPAGFGPVSSIQLHHFSDASEVGYGQCSYLRFETPQGKVHTSLVIAKARVTPIRFVSIPRLELTAALLSVKMARFLQEELDYDDIEHCYWTDSEIVLAYLNNQSKRFHVFVANRVQQILQFSKASQWRHVDTAENPADHPSRGVKVKDICASDWLRGPDFLSQPTPCQEQKFYQIPEGHEEVKICRATTVADHPLTSFEQRTQRFSTKRSLIRAVAVIIRRCAAKKGQQMERLVSYKQAETSITVCVQREHFDPPSVTTRSQLRELRAAKDDCGLWRVGGRHEKSTQHFECKHPVILPRNSHLALLTARDCHDKVAHQGRVFTIGKVRECGLWIIGMRHVVSTMIRLCVICRRQRGRPMQQMMGDLPRERLEPSPPFTNCGADCFGPFHVTDGRKVSKRYGLIITCLASRAVHLESLDDLSTDAFLIGLRNVIAIRGDISMIWCDRGTNFVGACGELKAAWKQMDQDSITTEMLRRGCTFHINTPSSSHMGGVWERQIRTVRSVLNNLLRRYGHQLTSSSLRTLLYEVMAIVNSRPLSVESLESPDSPRPLTPNHILTLKPGVVHPPPGSFPDAALYARQQWRRVQRLADDFWKRWRTEYLALLQSRRVWQRPQENVRVGDIVVLHDPNAKRSQWPLGRVERVYPGEDGLVRKVTLVMAVADLDCEGRAASGDRTLERPIHKLTVLISASDKEVDDPLL